MIKKIFITFILLCAVGLGIVIFNISESINVYSSLSSIAIDIVKIIAMILILSVFIRILLKRPNVKK